MSWFDFINRLMLCFSIFFSYHNWVEYNFSPNLSLLLWNREKKVSSYVPAHVAIGSGGLLSTLRGKSSRQAVLEQNLLVAYRKICTSAGNTPGPTQLLHQYLHTCHTLPYYGWVMCTFYSSKKIWYSWLHFQFMHSNSGALSFSGRLTNQHKGFSKEQSVKLSM